MLVLSVSPISSVVLSQTHTMVKSFFCKAKSYAQIPFLQQIFYAQEKDNLCFQIDLSESDRWGGWKILRFASSCSSIGEEGDEYLRSFHSFYFILFFFLRLAVKHVVPDLLLEVCSSFFLYEERNQLVLIDYAAGSWRIFARLFELRF